MAKFSRRPQDVKQCPCGKSNKSSHSSSYKFHPFIGETDYGYCFACQKTFYVPEDKDDKVQPIKRHEELVLPTQKFLKLDEVIQFYLDEFRMDNRLFKWMRGWVGDGRYSDLCKVVDMYWVGTLKDGTTVFPYIDDLMQWMTVKYVSYDEQTGKRQNTKADYRWAASNGYRQGLYGMHLLVPQNRCKRRVCLVESEKSAMIASMFMPQFLWVATGGTSVSDDKVVKMLKYLKGQVVYVVFDCDEAGRIGAVRLKEKMGDDVMVRIIDLDKGRKDGEDIGDFWYWHIHKGEPLPDMVIAMDEMVKL